MPVTVRSTWNSNQKFTTIASILAALALGGCGSAGNHSVNAGPAASTGASALPATSAPAQSASSAPAQSASAPAQSASPTGAQCVSSALQGLCHYPAEPGIVGAASNPWVGQNVWNGSSTYKQTLYSTDPGNWYVIANANTHFGGVLTYPNAGFYMSGAVDSYSSITSSFGTVIPDNAQTAAWAAYDLWFNSWKDEVMIQTDDVVNSDYDCTAKTTATIAGQPWHMCVFGSERVWKPGTDDQHLRNEPTGSVNIQAFLTWMEQNGYLPAGSTWTAGSYGFEICDTGGANETFQVNAFTWSALT